MASLHFQFTAPIQLLAKWGHNLVYLPPEIAEAYHAAGVKRLLCTMGGLVVNRAIASDGEGAHYILISRDLMRQLAMRQGEHLTVALQPDPKPNEPDLPEEFALLMEQDPELERAYHSLSPGTKRGLMHYIASAKREETRIKRCIEMGERMKKGDTTLLCKKPQ